MFSYKIYGLNIKSEIELPSALEIHSESLQADAYIKVKDYTERYQMAEYNLQILSENNSEGYTNIREKTEDGELHHILKVGTFCVTNGILIECMKCEGVDIYQFEQWLLNLAVGILMVQRERIVLHASGIKYGDNLIAISGESGSGKSTLADSLLKRKGFSFASDDSIALELLQDTVYAWGAYPLRRLCEDAVEYGEYRKEDLIFIPDGERLKYGMSMKSCFPEDAIPFSTLIILQVGEISHVLYEEVTGSQKLKGLLECLYKVDSYKEKGLTPKLLTECLQIASKIKVFRMTRPSTGMTTEEQIEKIHEIL
ncbi:MAG: hypothetical protein Q4B70_19115, partial [Lachnospiraceae bacterium]|nr:hypothetical protein [Lachnospiraceae bacterium]